MHQMFSEGEIQQICRAIVAEVDKAPDPRAAALRLTQKAGEATSHLSPDGAMRLHEYLSLAFCERYRLAAQCAYSAEDDRGGNQYVVIDGGDVFTSGFGNTGVFSVTVQSAFQFVDAICTREMATKFGLLQFSVSGFSSINLGYSLQSTVAQTNPCMTLAPFVPEYGRYPGTPFLGREFAANSIILVQGHELTGVFNRFMMTTVLMISACRPTCGTPILRSYGVLPR